MRHIDQRRAWLAGCVVVLAVAGCSPAAAWWPLVLLVLSVLASACVEVTPSWHDAGTSQEPDEDAGSWERCCEDGVISSCFCQAQTACNYGRFTDCGDGTCDQDPRADPELVCAAADAGPDAEAGNWERCCQDGVITTCFCPANVACNYGWFTNCGNGTCSEGIFLVEAGVCPADVAPDAQ